jgi:hypothetical protein
MRTNSQGFAPAATGLREPATALALEIEDIGIVWVTIQHCARHDGVAEEIAHSASACVVRANVKGPAPVLKWSRLRAHLTTGPALRGHDAHVIAKAVRRENSRVVGDLVESSNCCIAPYLERCESVSLPNYSMTSSPIYLGRSRSIEMLGNNPIRAEAIRLFSNVCNSVPEGHPALFAMSQKRPDGWPKPP